MATLYGFLSAVCICVQFKPTHIFPSYQSRVIDAWLCCENVTRYCQHDVYLCPPKRQIESEVAPLKIVKGGAGYRPDASLSGTPMSTTNPVHLNGRSGNSVRHSKEDALTEMEFEKLLEGARTLADSKYYYEHDPEFVIYVLGRLGLRRGELAHLKESWIDWREKMISIPEHEGCTKAREGEEVCGYCRQLAKQRVEVADDLDMETAVDWMWVPKTQAAARDVYFGFDPRAELYIERYFESEEYTGFEAGSTAVNRRVKRAAEEAKGIDPTNLSPHKLRATAATFHSSRGLKMLQLMQYMGWAQPQTAEVYIGRDGKNTARQLNSIHSV